MPANIGTTQVTAQTLAKDAGHTVFVIFKSMNLWKFPPSVIDWATKCGLDKFGKSEELTKPLPSGNKYISELDRLQSEAYIKIISGEKPIEYFDEFVKQWRAAGGDILEKEANGNK